MKKQCVMKYWLNVQKNNENPNTCIRYSNKALTHVYDPFTTFEKKHEHKFQIKLYKPFFSV